MNVMGERTRLLFVRFIYVHPQHAAVLCVLTFAIIMPGDVSRVAVELLDFLLCSRYKIAEQI